MKPDRQAHGSIALLVNALNQYVFPDVVTRLDTPDFILEGDHAVFTLTDPIAKTPARLVNAGRSKLRYTLAQITPGLYVWPDDTPHDIPGRQTETIKVVLGLLAKANESQFVLQTDDSADRRIVVRSPDLAAFRKKQQEYAEAVGKDVAAYAADPKNAALLSGLGTNEPSADEMFASSVADAVAKRRPGLPNHAQWVIAADYLTASNLPQVAATALRRAETLAPGSAKSSSVQWLGGVVAAQSGQANVFTSTSTPKLSKDEWQRANDSSRYTDLVTKATREEVVREFKNVPALRAHGWSLEGDTRLKAGDKEGAKAAYVEAANIKTSPSLDLRLEALDRSTPAIDEEKYAKGTDPTYRY